MIAIVAMAEILDNSKKDAHIANATRMAVAQGYTGKWEAESSNPANSYRYLYKLSDLVDRSRFFRTYSENSWEK